jgi:glycosyltransferase involved in cell wall biosynthesis
MNTRTPLVSVIVPAYNAARTLATTLQSVLEQTVSDFEIVVVDDGSSDGTAEVARSVVDHRIRVVTQENGGAAAARNNGIDHACGTWVAFLDADDVWVPNKLEQQLAYVDSRPGVDAVQTGAFFVNDQLEVLHVRRCKPSEDALLDTLLFRNLPAFLSTLMVRASRLEEIGHFDTELEILEEWDMAIKTARFCNLSSVEEPLCLYRTHGGNRSLNLDIHIAPGLLVLERLFADPDLPAHIRARRRSIYAHFYSMLAGGALRVGRYRECAGWAIKALRSDPRSFGYMAQLPVRRVSRLLSGLMQRRRGGVPGMPGPARS